MQLNVEATDKGTQNAIALASFVPHQLLLPMVIVCCLTADNNFLLKWLTILTAASKVATLPALQETVQTCLRALGDGTPFTSAFNPNRIWARKQRQESQLAIDVFFRVKIAFSDRVQKLFAKGEAFNERHWWLSLSKLFGPFTGKNIGSLFDRCAAACNRPMRRGRGAKSGATAQPSAHYRFCLTGPGCRAFLCWLFHGGRN
eukprot:9989952-Karenia_brevis.AAC.1